MHRLADMADTPCVGPWTLHPYQMSLTSIITLQMNNDHIHPLKLHRVCAKLMRYTIEPYLSMNTKQSTL